METFCIRVEGHVDASWVGWLGLTRLAHLSISWLLLNWWLHDSLHVHNGENMRGLLTIEYGFHVTLMLAGVILGVFLLKVLRGLEAR